MEQRREPDPHCPDGVISIRVSENFKCRKCDKFFDCVSEPRPSGVWVRHRQCFPGKLKLVGSRSIKRAAISSRALTERPKRSKRRKRPRSRRANSSRGDAAYGRHKRARPTIKREPCENSTASSNPGVLISHAMEQKYNTFVKRYALKNGYNTNSWQDICLSNTIFRSVKQQELTGRGVGDRPPDKNVPYYIRDRTLSCGINFFRRLRGLEPFFTQRRRPNKGRDTTDPAGKCQQTTPEPQNHAHQLHNQQPNHTISSTFDRSDDNVVLKTMEALSADGWTYYRDIYEKSVTLGHTMPDDGSAMLELSPSNVLLQTLNKFLLSGKIQEHPTKKNYYRCLVRES